jgi:hypothetical protein
VSGDKIIQFPSTGDIPPCVVDIEEKYGFCQHPQIRLVVHERVVVCEKCGACLDPFAYLLSEARAIRAAWGDYRAVKHKVSDLQQQVEALQRTHKRLSAAVRRDKKKSEKSVVDLRNPE